MIDEVHRFLTERGYLYLGESCGCNGTPKSKRYTKTGKTLKVISKQERYYFEHNRIKKNIHELFTDTEV